MSHSLKKINPQDKTVASLTDKELREMAGKDKEQNSRTYRDQLITIGDLEIFKQNLIEEIRHLLAQASSSHSKKWAHFIRGKKALGINCRFFDLPLVVTKAQLKDMRCEDN